MEIPRKSTAQTQDAGLSSISCRAESVRDVVVTPTVNVEAVAALTDTVRGAVQVAPVGAPVHDKLAAPPRPFPPIDTVYVAALPACTVCEDEPDVARPRVGVPAVPARETVCGLPEALSVIVNVPLTVPLAEAEGAKATETVQLDPAAKAGGQSLVS